MARLLVIGGGIGGLTTALAFSSLNWDVSVHEAAQELHPVGKGIWVPINAMQVFASLGLAERISQAGCPLRSVELRTASGTHISTLKLEGLAARYGQTVVSMHRAKLVEILADAMRPGVLHLGSRFTHFEQELTQVRAYFEDGSGKTADLLVGADGIHSRVREQLFPGVPLRYSGQTCFRGVSEIALPNDLARICREIWGGKNRFGFSPVGPDQVYWFAPQLSPPGEVDSPEARTRSLLDSYRHFPNPVPDILAATRIEDTIRTDLFDFPPIASWSANNVALLGDAAHAMTPNLGQGGAQAVEDAYVLARQFARTASIPEALKNYERIRIPKARSLVKASWAFGQIAHWQNPLAQWARDAAIRWTPHSVEQKQLDKLYRLSD
jgi:2-polyprenyl-6-methoxyphenol hydroxylase-like FAD-dependent oxidoreductase